MKRAEIVDASAPLKVVSTSILETPLNGARLRTTFAGVCHSDIHVIKDENVIGSGLVLRNRDIFKELGNFCYILQRPNRYQCFDIFFTLSRYTLQFKATLHILLTIIRTELPQIASFGEHKPHILISP